MNERSVSHQGQSGNDSGLHMLDGEKVLQKRRVGRKVRNTFIFVILLFLSFAFYLFVPCVKVRGSSYSPIFSDGAVMIFKTHQVQGFLSRGKKYDIPWFSPTILLDTKLTVAPVDFDLKKEFDFELSPDVVSLFMHESGKTAPRMLRGAHLSLGSFSTYTSLYRYNMLSRLGKELPEVDFLTLHELCESGDATPEQVQEFLDLDIDLNEGRGEFGRTPLMLASENNSNVDVIRLLLNSGADVNAQDGIGLTPLHLAARSNVNPEVITLLLEAGADVDVERNGNTPLHFASARNETTEVITVLLEAGADVDAKNVVGGWTPLHFAAAATENPEVISLLLKAGADADAEDKDGQRALDHLRKNESLQGTDALKALEAATNQ